MTGKFDLKVPRYSSSQWYNALSIAVEQLQREEAEEKANTDEIATYQRFQTAGIMLLAQAVTSFIGEKPFAQAKEMSEKFAAFETAVIVKQTGKSIEEVNKEAVERAEKAKTAGVDASVNAWQSIFGQRGSDATETAIKNTQNILLSMIAQSEAEKKKNAPAPVTRPKRGKK